MWWSICTVGQLLMRKRIFRRISPGIGTQNGAGQDELVQILDSWGESHGTLDFKDLSGVPCDIRDFLRAALEGAYGHLDPKTIKSRWKCVRVFIKFLEIDGQAVSLSGLDDDLIFRFITFLRHRKSRRSGNFLSEDTKRHYLSAVMTLIAWTKHNRPGLLIHDIAPRPRVFPVGEPRNRRHLTRRELKILLNHCYSEIDAAYERFLLGRKILESNSEVDGCGERFCEILRTVSRKFGGNCPRSADITPWQLQKISKVFGGLSVMAQYMHLTSRTVVPFYIAICIQTAGNPDAVRLMDADCVVPTGFKPDTVMVKWKKPRAGKKLHHSQHRFFSLKARNSVPNLIAMLKEMNSPIRRYTSVKHRDLLFVCWIRGHGIGLLAGATLHKKLSGFIEQLNSKLEDESTRKNYTAPESIRPFTISDVRRSVALEHFKGSGGDIVAAKTVLNHRSLRTTIGYIESPDAKRISQENMATLQGLLVEWFTGQGDERSQPVSPHRGKALNCAVTPSFSGTCSDPLAGTAPGSKVGKVCPHFGACWKCPHHVFPLDVDYLGRLLIAIEAHEAARLKMHPSRWNLLYRPSYETMKTEILPLFNEELFESARAKRNEFPPFPVLL